MGSGRDVFFSTQDRLVPQDTDTLLNIYDARENGGFPAPLSATGCSGDACQGSLGASPLLPSLGGSATQSGGENVTLPVSKPVVKPKAKPLTRAQKLAKGAEGVQHEAKEAASRVRSADEKEVRDDKKCKEQR